MDELLSRDQLKEFGINFERSYLWRLMKAGNFPASVQLGVRKRAWVKAEVMEWIEERKRLRNAA